MNVRNTLYAAFACYPLLYKRGPHSRLTVFEHWFLVGGNGYKWTKQGDLVTPIFTKRKQHKYRYTLDEYIQTIKQKQQQERNYCQLDGLVDLYDRMLATFKPMEDQTLYLKTLADRASLQEQERYLKHDEIELLIAQPLIRYVDREFYPNEFNLKDQLWHPRLVQFPDNIKINWANAVREFSDFIVVSTPATDANHKYARMAIEKLNQLGK